MTSRFAGIFTRVVPGTHDLGSAVRQMLGAIRRTPSVQPRCWVDTAGGVALAALNTTSEPVPSATGQPAHSPSRRFRAVMNGRLEHRGDLERDLERAGLQARGCSESHLILAAFDAWGVEEALRRVAGSFAIAAWDVANRRLVLIRDRLGMKPLFVLQRPGMVAFGSDLAALMATPGFERVLDPDSLADYLRYLYVPAPRTIFRDVFQLLPGQVLAISDPDQTAPDPVAYWSLRDVAREGIRHPFAGSHAEAVAELEQRLRVSIQSQTRARGPLAALLSGGIDSTTIVALAQEETDRRLQTFSIGFDDEAYNEAPYALLVAKHLDTDHTQLVVSDREVLTAVSRLPEVFDQPIGNPAQIPMFLACQLACRKVGTLLSGEGGDELFAGYNRYLFGERLIERASSLPRLVRHGLAKGVEVLQPRSWDRLHAMLRLSPPRMPRQHGLGGRLYKVAHLLRQESSDAMYRSLLSAWQEPTRFVAGASGAPQSAVSLAFADDSIPLLAGMMLHDQMVYLPGELLAKVDRLEMAMGIGFAMPLLDHRIAEFSWRLPRSWKVHNGQTKWPLRQLLYSRVPPEMMERPKMGFSVPIERWLRGGLRSWADDLLSEASLKRGGLLRTAPIQQAWQWFLNGDASSALGLWAILNFQAWHEHWLNG